MTNATFYYVSPLTPNKDRGFFEKMFKDDERKILDNVNALVSKLSMAKEELSQDCLLDIRSWVADFPVFGFYISSNSLLYQVSKRLLEITSPIFPFNVESDKKGYELVEKLVSSEYGGFLKRAFLRPGRKIVIPSIKP